MRLIINISEGKIYIRLEAAPSIEQEFDNKEDALEMLKNLFDFHLGAHPDE